MNKKQSEKSYNNHGRQMSRRAIEAVANNEYPINHWTDTFSMTSDEIEKLLIYMGVHHIGRKLIRFFRLPNPYNTSELMTVYHAFHLVPETKLNFINTMSKHLQVRIADRYTSIPVLSMPRQRIRRKDWKKGRRRRRKYRVV